MMRTKQREENPTIRNHQLHGSPKSCNYARIWGMLIFSGITKICIHPLLKIDYPVVILKIMGSDDNWAGAKILHFYEIYKCTIVYESL